MNEVKFTQFSTFTIWSLMYLINLGCSYRWGCQEIVRCPQDFTYYVKGNRRTCLYLSDVKKHYLESIFICAMMDSRAWLTFIDSQPKSDFYNSLSLNYTDYIWLDVMFHTKTRKITSPHQLGHPDAKFTNFLFNGPRSPKSVMKESPKKFCGGMNTETGKWEVLNCDSNHHFICEVEPYSYDPRGVYITYYSSNHGIVYFHDPFIITCVAFVDGNHRASWGVLVGDELKAFFTHEDFRVDTTTELVNQPGRGCILKMTSRLFLEISTSYVSPELEDKVRISCLITPHDTRFYQCHATNTLCMNTTYINLKREEGMPELSLEYHVKKKSLFFTGIRANFRCSICKNNAKMSYYIRTSTNILIMSDQHMETKVIETDKCENLTYGDHRQTFETKANSLIWSCKVLINGTKKIESQILYNVDYYPQKPNLNITQDGFNKKGTFLIGGLPLQANCSACVGYSGTLIWEIYLNDNRHGLETNLNHLIHSENITTKLSGNTCGEIKTSIIYINATEEIAGAKLYCYSFKQEPDGWPESVYVVSDPLVLIDRFDIPIGAIDDTALLFKLLATALVFIFCIATVCFFCGGKRHQTPSRNANKSMLAKKCPDRKVQGATDAGSRDMLSQRVDSHGTNTHSGQSTPGMKSSRQTSQATKQAFQASRMARKPSVRSNNQKQMVERMQQIKQQQQQIMSQIKIARLEKQNSAQQSSKKETLDSTLQDKYDREINRLQHLLNQFEKGSAVDPTDVALLTTKKGSDASNKSDAQATFIE